MKLSFFYQPFSAFLSKCATITAIQDSPQTRLVLKPFFCHLPKINHNNSNIELSPKTLVFSKIFYNNLLKIGCNKSNIEISHETRFFKQSFSAILSKWATIRAIWNQSGNVSLSIFSANFFSQLEQGDGFHSYLQVHYILNECYQCDEVFSNTQPEGTGYNSVEWLLPKLLFTLRAGKRFSFLLLM